MRNTYTFEEKERMAMKVVTGYFDRPDQTVPTFDPGLPSPCPVCSEDVHPDHEMKTISVMATEPRERCYFFRAHKACWETAGDALRSNIESAVIDGPIH